MPVAFLRTAPSRACAPVAGLTMRLGSDPTCDLVDSASGVAPLHAVLRYVKGEWLLAAEPDLDIHVNGEAVPLMALRPGDILKLSERGATYTFRNRLANAFVAPGTTLAAAWRGHPDFLASDHGPSRLGAGEGVGGRDPQRCARVTVGKHEWVVKQSAPARSVEELDRHLALLAALGGSPHRAVARLMDGGIAPAGDTVVRWHATRWVEGAVVRDLQSDDGQPMARVVAMLRDLAAGLAHLHRRGVIHRDVAPGNIVVAEDRAVLIDLGQALLVDGPRSASPAVVGTPGFVAPEEVLSGPDAITPAADVYGLAAVGYALLVGFPPAGGDDVLDALSRAARPPIAPRELGVDLPDALEEALLQGLQSDPASRPEAAGLRAVLEQVEAQLGLGGRT